MISTGTNCFPTSCRMPISVRKSNFNVSMILPFSSLFASRVPLNSLETQTWNSCSPIFLSLKHGRVESSLIKDTIGPGIPVPFPAVAFDPAISLTIWKNQLTVPNSIFSSKFFPMNVLSVSSTINKAPLVSVPMTLPVNCVNREHNKPPRLKWWEKSRR